MKFDPEHNNFQIGSTVWICYTLYINIIKPYSVGIPLFAHRLFILHVWCTLQRGVQPAFDLYSSRSEKSLTLLKMYIGSVAPTAKRKIVYMKLATSSRTAPYIYAHIIQYATRNHYPGNHVTYTVESPKHGRGGNCVIGSDAVGFTVYPPASRGFVACRYRTLHGNPSSGCGEISRKVL